MNYFNSHDRPPETIWAWHFVHEKQNDVMKGGWDNVKDHTCTEYTRTDISQARIAQLEATMKKDAKIYYDSKAIIDAHQVIYREARGEQRARIAELEEALEVITARAEMATVCDNDSFNFGWMVKLARAALKAKP
jgi:5-methylthioribose kinase